MPKQMEEKDYFGEQEKCRLSSRPLCIRSRVPYT